MASGGGHDLNASLLERLVRGGAPHVTLATQHRMRPEISALHRATYPGLVDHPAVRNQPSLCGVAGPLAFVDHGWAEDGWTGASGWLNPDTSHANAAESQMTVAVVQHLLNQGYRPEQLVVRRINIFVDGSLGSLGTDPLLAFSHTARHVSQFAWL